MKYDRLCPQCKETIYYKNKSQINEAERKHRICVKCRNLNRVGKKHTDEWKRIASKRLRGNNNPMYGKRFSLEHLNKLSAASKGINNPNYGKKHSKVTKEKISKTNKGRIKTPEEIKKQSAALRGRPGPNLGRKFSEESRRKMSDSHKSRFAAGKSGSGLGAWYKGTYFRSLSELRYIVEEVEPCGLYWRTAETLDLTINYTDPYGFERVYHPDFLINESMLVEIKPKYYHNNPIMLAKVLAANVFCNEKGYSYNIIDAKPLNYNKLINLYKLGDVILTDKLRTALLKKGFINE